MKKDNPHLEGLGTRISNRFRGLGLKQPLPELRGEVWARPANFSGKDSIEKSDSEPSRAADRAE